LKNSAELANIRSCPVGDKNKKQHGRGVAPQKNLRLFLLDADGFTIVEGNVSLMDFVLLAMDLFHPFATQNRDCRRIGM
jgi:hypothetical protein